MYTFSGLQIALANPIQIIKWTLRIVKNQLFIGEIKEPLTINFKTGLPGKNGLFCENIFGPIFSWTCNCGYYPNKDLSIIYSSELCIKCGKELTTNKVRKQRLGFINLVCPIFHSWYKINNYKILSSFSSLSSEELETFIYYKEAFSFYKFSYFKKFLVGFKHFSLSSIFFPTHFLQKKLTEINLLKEIEIIRIELISEKNNKKKKGLITKLKLFHLFFSGNLHPSWMFLTILPVLPAGLRPMYFTDNKTLFNSPINTIYKLILIKNNKLKRFKLLRPSIPYILEIYEKKALQCSIDILFSTKSSNKLYSVLTNFYGNKNIFKSTLLGKRVDFSGRSVIIPGSDFQLTKVGIPLSILLELFKPYIFKIFITFLNTKISKIYGNFLGITSYRTLLIKIMIKKLLEQEILFINRAPTLHKLSIRAFKPIFSEYESIKIFPLACGAFNADFDGDQMGVFLPLSSSAKKEAKYLMSSDKHILTFTNSSILKPSQSIVLGLSSIVLLKKLTNTQKIFIDFYDSLTAYMNQIIDLTTLIWIKQIEFVQDIRLKTKYFLTTIGRVIGVPKF